jgi:hypothetical protein
LDCEDFRIKESFRDTRFSQELAERSFEEYWILSFVLLNVGFKKLIILCELLIRTN